MLLLEGIIVDARIDFSSLSYAWERHFSFNDQVPCWVSISSSWTFLWAAVFPLPYCHNQ